MRRPSWISLAFILLVYCGDSQAPDTVQVPASLAIVAGDAQAGEAGQALAESLAVVVRDTANAAVAGVTVSWAIVTGGGAIAPASGVTNTNGIARARRTLGPTVGPQTATASVASLGGVTFTAASRLNGGVNLGNRTIGPLSDTTLGTNDQPLIVMVTNEKNEPVPGVVVTWSASGGGSVSATSQPTDAGGESSVQYTFGPSAGQQFAQASVTGLVGSPIGFTLDATAGNAATIAKSAGDGLAAAAGAQVIHRVIARDARNNPRSGVTIDWAAASGGGSITPAQNVTDASGLAEATRTLGATIGTQTSTATALSIPGGAVTTFSTTATAPPGTTIALSAGDGQAADVGQALPDSLAVILRDGGNSPLAGVSVNWAVGAGGGSITPATSITGVNGIARARRTLGPAAGSHTATASVSGVGQVSFNSIARIQGASSLANATVGPLADTTLASRTLSVVAKNELDQAVPGVMVAWTASGGGSVSTPTQATDADGKSTVLFTFGPTAGLQNAEASVLGLPGSPVSFSLEASAGNPASIIKFAGDNLTANVEGQVIHRVKTADARGNPRAGVTIDWAVATGGGSITPLQNTTGADGTAEATRTLGTSVGSQTATATASAITGTNQVTFTTNAVLPPAVVQVSNNQFSPASVTITLGGSVSWAWQPGSVAHNVTFAATPGAPAGIGDRTSGSVQRTFGTAGTYDYQCTNHVGMTGSVTVNP